MPLIKRFNAFDEYSRLLSTSGNRNRQQSDTEKEAPLHRALPLLKETQATFQRLRRDPDVSQTNVFRISAPFFTFAYVLATVATALRKDIMPSPGLGVLVLMGFLVTLAVLRAIIWGGAVAIDEFLLVDIGDLGVTSRKNKISKLNQRSILFSGFFS
ncbi:hypothetical protein BDR04DRAFT_1094955 [Suillus decipiens]|nr:hypothetical protein BDR04DRAFT_1094955 [Suillus decipiens]